LTSGTRLVFGINGKGFLIPLKIRIKLEIFFGEFGVCTHFIRESEKPRDYILFGNKGNILDVTENICNQIFSQTCSLRNGDCVDWLFFFIQKHRYMYVWECVLTFFCYQIKWRNLVSTRFSRWLKKSVKIKDSKKSSSAKWILKIKILRKNPVGRSNPCSHLGSRLIKTAIIVKMANCLIFSFQLI